MSIDILGFVGLGADRNKQQGNINQENKEGIVSEKLPELTLTMPDSDIDKLTTKWEKSWNDSDVKSKWLKQCDENEKYWLGQHFDMAKGDNDRPYVDNLIFESLETYLPQVTRRNPEPIVTLDQSEDSDQIKEAYVTKVKNRLGDIADKNKIRLKLKRGARYWAMYLIGVAKFGWGLDQDIPIVRMIRPQKMILDPEYSIDEDGYHGEFIGEFRKLSATKILSIIGDKETEGKKAIDELVEKDTGTSIQFIEWWTPEFMCWKLGKKILLKRKNPHWNYDQSEKITNTDDYGNDTESKNETKGINFFTHPRMPYEFLSVFNLGDQPIDRTSLIGQNLANQDLINKRNKQIDKNADRMNGGCIISLEKSGLTQGQAKTVVSAVRAGGAVTIPAGNAQDAIYFPTVSSLPSDVFNQLFDVRSRMRDIFGTRGSSPAGIQDEKTVRGKIMNRGLDTDRIGGGISEYLEQFADDIYNWFVQLLYVYDTGFQFVAGAEPPKIVVSVKEGSLLPKDSTSIANQAISLAEIGKLSMIDLYKRLEWPNPEEIAANVWLETNAPQLLYGSNQMVQQAMAGIQAANQAKADAEAQVNQMKFASKNPVNKSMLSEVPQDTMTSTQ